MPDRIEQRMTGADALVSTLADHGVSACFANPGTSEMHLVTALDHEPRIRSVLCLFEGVASGAADGFGRIAGGPAMTLLHLGAGYLNAGANIHNAKRAFTPIVNVIGDHAVPHQRYDAPLTSNIMGMAGPNSVWIKSADKVEIAGEMAAEAWAASFGPAPGPAALILPADTAWKTGGVPGKTRQQPNLHAPDAETVEAVAKALRGAARPVLIMNGTALSENGLKAASRLEAAGIRVLTDTFYGIMARGQGRYTPGRMQYFAEQAIDDLSGCDLMVVAGSAIPVAFFAYPEKPSVLVPEGCTPLILCGPETDSAAAVAALADALGAKEEAKVAVFDAPTIPSGALNAMTIGASIARHLPENAFVSDDGVSNGLPAYFATGAARRHDWMMLTGGAIGQGMPLALGAAIAAPDRKGLCLTGDGAGMYTLQALWSMAREDVDVVTIVFVNHSYRILNIEMMRTGAGNPGPSAKSMLEIGGPDIDWVQLSQSLGVPAVSVDTAEEFDRALERAFAQDGPQLIAAIVA